MQKLLDVIEDLDDVQDVYPTPRSRRERLSATEQPMNVLVIGGGGREHALAWKLAQSPRVRGCIVAPGNAGTARDPRLDQRRDHRPRRSSPTSRSPRRSALTVVGPEAPLAAGVVDAFRARGLRIFGPTQAAAQLESSKDFAKAFMQRHGIPTARVPDVHRRRARRTRYVDAQGRADRRQGRRPRGRQGRGRRDDAWPRRTRRSTRCSSDNRWARPARASSIEEFLAGEEASFIVLVRRHATSLPLATAQDHKRLLDGDSGPNTGGMGAYSPAPVVTPDDARAHHARDHRCRRSHGMAADGIPYTGFLYAGLMIDADGKPRTCSSSTAASAIRKRSRS